MYPCNKHRAARFWDEIRVLLVFYGILTLWMLMSLTALMEFVPQRFSDTRIAPQRIDPSLIEHPQHM